MSNSVMLRYEQKLFTPTPSSNEYELFWLCLEFNLRNITQDNVLPDSVFVTTYKITDKCLAKCIRKFDFTAEIQRAFDRLNIKCKFLKFIRRKIMEEVRENKTSQIYFGAIYFKWVR